MKKEDSKKNLKPQKKSVNKDKKGKSQKKALKHDKSARTLKKKANKNPKLQFERVKLEKKETLGIKKKFQGEVVSDKMDKTIVVKLSRIDVHPKYHKRCRKDKRCKVHDPGNTYKIGDMVEFIPSKPYSKEKRWIVCNK